MPRVARRKGLYCTYHLVQRGNDRKNIFLGDEDKVRFLETLEKARIKHDFRLYSYCLMNNHFHLLLYDNGNDVSSIMKSINTSYAIYFNRRHQKSGHLFQDRFKSEVVEDDGYFLAVSRYIHNNPVKAGMVEEVARYRWSSFRVYAGLALNELCLLDTSRVLGCFSDDPRTAKRHYIEFVTGGLEVEHNILDVEDELSDAPGLNHKYINDIVQARTYVEEFLKREHVTMEELLMDKKKRNLLIKDLRAHSSLSLKEIGMLVGGISESRVSRILNG